MVYDYSNAGFSADLIKSYCALFIDLPSEIEHNADFIKKRKNFF